MNSNYKLIAEYLKNQRIRHKKTQEELAKEAGISLITLRRAESGKILSLDTVIAIIEVFGELENFKSFFVINEKTPRELLRGKKKKRQRVRKSEKMKVDSSDWKWGEDEP